MSCMMLSASSNAGGAHSAGAATAEDKRLSCRARGQGVSSNIFAGALPNGVSRGQSLRDSISARLGRSSSVAAARQDVYKTLQESIVIDARDGSAAAALQGVGATDWGEPTQAVVVVLLPQLGDFDSAEYAEHLAAVSEDLAEANVGLRVIGIGEPQAALRFAEFTGLPLDVLRIDPTATVHRAVGVHEGPGWDFPDAIPDDLRSWIKGWSNYLAMCAGIESPGTVAEIARGYLGDRSAPERLSPASTVSAGPVEIIATQAWRIGPLGADLWWKNESGYQRPVELATVRLKNMVEVLENMPTYVTDPEHLGLRGASFVFENGELVYEWRDRGVLQYSETMARPLQFLEPYLGAAIARNALRLGDSNSAAEYNS